jgi:hypothetical protein
MAGSDPGAPVTRTRDGTAWRIGTAAEVAWITSGTRNSSTINAAIPPAFAAYATVALSDPEDGFDPPDREMEWRQSAERTRVRHEQFLIDVLTEHSASQRWWLGYLDTGAADVIFPDAPRVSPHYGWGYVLIAAGPPQAATWRECDWKIAMPDLIFPSDREWLVSMLWDDYWTCIGGPGELVEALLAHPVLAGRTRQVRIDEDATPPGHQTS